jgi:hypothetical protein
VPRQKIYLHLFEFFIHHQQSSLSLLFPSPSTHHLQEGLGYRVKEGCQESLYTQPPWHPSFASQFSREISFYFLDAGSFRPRKPHISDRHSIQQWRVFFVFWPPMPLLKSCQYLVAIWCILIVSHPRLPLHTGCKVTAWRWCWKSQEKSYRPARRGRWTWCSTSRSLDTLPVLNLTTPKLWQNLFR